MVAKTRTTNTAASGAQTPATPEAVLPYLIVTNLTPQMQVIVADEEARQARPLLLRPYEALTFKAADLAVWQGDGNFQAALEGGLVRVTSAAGKARAIPREPDNSLDAYEKSVLSQIVYGAPQEAERLITFDVPEPLRGEWGAYMRSNYATILTLAATWLKRWGPPEPLKERLALIEKRLAALKQASLDVVS